MIFIANWICRSGMVVLSSTPAFPGERAVGDNDVPVASKMSVLPSPGPGGAKFGWLRILNISARNCTLKFSENTLICLFLNTEKSRSVVPGPIMILRPAFPRRLKHWSELGSTGPPRLGGAGSQLADQNAVFGAVGMVKHCVLI